MSVALAVTFASLAACSENGAPPKITAPPTTSGASEEPLATTPAATTEPAPTTAAASPIPGVTPMPTTEAELAPGTYTFPPFAPAVSFRVGDGWSAGHALEEYFDVQQPEVAVGFGAPAFVFDRQGVRRDVEGMTPHDAAATLAANPDLRPGPVESETVGGLPGSTVVLRPRVETDVYGKTGNYTALVGTSLRITFVRVHGEMVVVMALARAKPFDRWFAEAERVIRTVSFP